MRVIVHRPNPCKSATFNEVTTIHPSPNGLALSGKGSAPIAFFASGHWTWYECLSDLPEENKA